MEFKEVLSLEELPEGSAKTVEVEGKAVALYNVGGEVFATDNSCVHQGGPLGQGDLEGEIITCPLHAWTYNVKSGECQNMPGAKVQVFKAKVENGKIFVEV